jgi:hypothetical protein
MPEDFVDLDPPWPASSITVAESEEEVCSACGAPTLKVDGSLSAASGLSFLTSRTRSSLGSEEFLEAMHLRAPASAREYTIAPFICRCELPINFEQLSPPQQRLLIVVKRYVRYVMPSASSQLSHGASASGTTSQPARMFGSMATNTGSSPVVRRRDASIPLLGQGEAASSRGGRVHAVAAVHRRLPARVLMT